MLQCVDGPFAEPCPVKWSIKVSPLGCVSIEQLANQPKHVQAMRERASLDAEGRIKSHRQTRLSSRNAGAIE